MGTSDSTISFGAIRHRTRFQAMVLVPLVIQPFRSAFVPSENVRVPQDPCNVVPQRKERSRETRAQAEREILAAEQGMSWIDPYKPSCMVSFIQQSQTGSLQLNPCQSRHRKKQPARPALASQLRDVQASRATTWGARAPVSLPFS